MTEDQAIGGNMSHDDRRYRLTELVLNHVLTKLEVDEVTADAGKDVADFIRAIVDGLTGPEVTHEGEPVDIDLPDDLKQSMFGGTTKQVDATAAQYAEREKRYCPLTGFVGGDFGAALDHMKAGGKVRRSCRFAAISLAGGKFFKHNADCVEQTHFSDADLLANDWQSVE